MQSFTRSRIFFDFSLEPPLRKPKFNEGYENCHSASAFLEAGNEERRVMPSFTSTLEAAIHAALGYANERKHELATLEHLLLALIDEPDAARVMTACGVSLPELRRSLVKFVDEELDSLVSEIDGSQAAPTTGFQRVIQRAAIHVQSSGRNEVTGANVIVAIFAERESHAAYFLQQQDMTRYDAVNFISHGVAKDPSMAESKPVTGAATFTG